MEKISISADRVKQAIRAEDFYRYELPNATLRRHAWTKAGLCPFHEDRREGSFYIHRKSGAYRCFACGAKGGDIIDYIRERYGLSFLEALLKLCDEWGVP